MSNYKPTLFSSELGYILDIRWEKLEDKLRIFIVGSMEIAKYDIYFSKLKELGKNHSIETIKVGLMKRVQ